METRSRRRAIADPGSAEHFLESPVTRSSSEETLNLTVMMGDSSAGDVGTSHPRWETPVDYQELVLLSRTLALLSTVESGPCQGTSWDF